MFPAGYMRGTRRLTTRLMCVTILEPAGYTRATRNMHARVEINTRVENQHPCSQQKSLFYRLTLECC